MSARRRLPIALALATCLVVAGCGVPSGDRGATDTPSPTPAGTETAAADGIEVRNGSLPVDPDRTFDRTRGLLGSDAAPPPAVVVADDGNVTEEPSVPAFWSLAGVEPRDPVEPVGAVENGYTTALGTIVLAPGESSNASRVERLLVHEFVHYVQFRERRASALRGRLPATTDGSFVARAVLEGVAVYATDAYVDRYGDDRRRNSEIYPRLRAAYPAGSYQRYALAQYVEGRAYVADRLGTDPPDPAAADAIYERPPTTSEQVIHGLAPGEEPPRELRVTVRTAGGDGPGFSPAGRDTMGEAFVRAALENGVDESRAAEAAAGWGNDSRVVFRDGDGVGYAWVLRWDDAANASEFRPAAVQYLAGQDTVDAFRVESVGAETVVVLLGDRSFVREASVGGTGGNVTVAVGS